MARTAHRELTPEETLRWTRVGMLAALAMLLGYLETFVPIPIPGVKLGLANIAILVALAQGDVGGAFGIATIKVLASGLLFGSPVTMAYSAMGTLCAFVLMAPLSRIPGMHVVALSVVGAVAHELGQLCVAMWLLGTPLVWYSAPMLLVAGCATGALCGLVAASTVDVLQRGEDAVACAGVLAADGGRLEAEQVAGGKGGMSAGGRATAKGRPAADGEEPAAMSYDSEGRRALEPEQGGESWGSIDVSPPLGRVGEARGHLVSGRVALVGFAAFCACALRASSAWALAWCLAAAVIACIAGKVRLRKALRGLRPLAPIVIITLVAQVASSQHGEVVCGLGPVSLTREALVASATLLVRLLALTLSSLAVMHLASLDELIDAVAWLLAPFGRLGLRVDGFVLALQSAVRFLPALAAVCGDRAVTLRSQLGTRKLWTEALPQLIAQLYRKAGV